MATAIREDMTVRDLVVEQPTARRVLEAHGVDYCCGGAKPLGQAVAESGTTWPDLVGELEQARQAPAVDERDWAGASLTELVQHIVDTHHALMRRELPRLETLFGQVIAAHGEHHGEMLRVVRDVFAALREEIEMHLLKEEQILFPYVLELDQAVRQGRRLPPMHCGTVQNPIAQMEHEHDNAGHALAEMRRLMHDYAVPEDACPTFKELLDTLQRVEADLHEHIHLENNILFPRSVQAETKACG